MYLFTVLGTWAYLNYHAQTLRKTCARLNYRLNHWHHWKDHPRISLADIFSLYRRSNSRRSNASTKAIIVSSKSQLRGRKCGYHPRIWPVLQFRRPARSRWKEDNETHTPIVLRWRPGERGGRGSSIHARCNAFQCDVAPPTDCSAVAATVARPQQ